MALVFKSISFTISEKEGFSYAKESKDKNKIHIDENYSYNSIYRHKIVHGCLLLLKIINLLKLNNFLKKNYSIKIFFNKPAKYFKKIDIKIKKKKIDIFQEKKKIANIVIGNFNHFNYQRLKLVKFSNRINVKNSSDVLRGLINKTSEFVGKKENSLICSIEINKDKASKFGKKIKIFRKKISRNYPLISNKLTFNNYSIIFESLIRPSLKYSKFKISKNLKKKILKLNDDILIIGASSGIGKELLNLLRLNKHIKIYSTYYKNKVPKQEKSYKIDLNLKKSIKIISRIIKISNNLIIYYFATPPININDSSLKKLKEYKNFYLNFPRKILTIKNKKCNIKFFYPSTILINKNDKSNYTKIKYLAEKKLSKLKNKNIKINFLRIEKINTRQNLSLIKEKIPSFIQLLNKKIKYQKKIFFES
jgi:hypothetical protein